MKHRVWWLALLTALAFTLGAPLAHAETLADRLAVDITVNKDGSATVVERLTFTAAPGTVTRTLPLTWDVDGTSYYRFDVSDPQVAFDEAPIEGFSRTSDALRLSADLTSPGVLTTTYTVTGATSTSQGESGPLSVMTWPALYGLSVGVRQVQVHVDGPSPQVMDCVAGPLDSIGKCGAISGGTYDTPDPTFQDGPRAANDEVVVTVGYDPADVAPDAQLEHHWSLDRAFEVSVPTIGWALLAALVGVAALYLLHRRTGQDLRHSTDPTMIASFVPTGDGESIFEVRDGIRPGHVGTVADERVDPIDVTATILDLAVRGHLLITELPRTAHGLLDWSLHRRTCDDPLAPFEQALLDVIAPVGEARLVSELPTILVSGMPAVQDALYNDVVARGWFESRPDSTRSSWRIRGWLSLGIVFLGAVALVALTNLGVLALILLALGVGMVWISDRMPRRTAAGSALLEGLEALGAVLAVQPTDQLPRGRELAEASKILPYAVVLGGRERWLQALVAADPDVSAPDPDALDWYHAPETWHLQDLPASLTQFVHTVQGELFSR